MQNDGLIVPQGSPYCFFVKTVFENPHLKSISEAGTKDARSGTEKANINYPKIQPNFENRPVTSCQIPKVYSQKKQSQYFFNSWRTAE